MINDEQRGTILLALKIGLFAALGFWAAGPLGAAIGLILAFCKK